MGWDKMFQLNNNKTLFYLTFFCCEDYICKEKKNTVLRKFLMPQFPSRLVINAYTQNWMHKNNDTSTLKPEVFIQITGFILVGI